MRNQRRKMMQRCSTWVIPPLLEACDLSADGCSTPSPLVSRTQSGWICHPSTRASESHVVHLSNLHLTVSCYWSKHSKCLCLIPTQLSYWHSSEALVRTCSTRLR